MSEMPAGRGVIPAVSQLPLFARTAEARSPILDVHAISRPARGFTGDFYFTHRQGTRLWFALGDVAGKGINAAVVMAMIQEELERRITSCARTECDPAATVTRLHEFLRPLLPSNRFATVIIGHLHDDGTLRIANGGHCPALIARSAGTVEQIGSTGPVAGLIAGTWTSVRANLRKGDKLVLFSDGLVEGRSPDGEEFGLDRVVEIASRPGRARETITRLATAFDSHTVRRRDDDLTIFAAVR
ncbi:MAG: serine/threonine-protein phosphatase [Thermoanaerobaculia bacterium]|nr:serine/threonine-protein phosphatase [Thermoanaerobaculia bacterium]